MWRCNSNVDLFIYFFVLNEAAVAVVEVDSGYGIYLHRTMENLDLYATNSTLFSLKQESSGLAWKAKKIVPSYERVRVASK